MPNSEFFIFMLVLLVDRRRLKSKLNRISSPNLVFQSPTFTLLSGCLSVCLMALAKILISSDDQIRNSVWHSLSAFTSIHRVVRFRMNCNEQFIFSELILVVQTVQCKSYVRQCARLFKTNFPNVCKSVGTNEICQRKSNEFGGKWVFAYSPGLSVTVIHGFRFFTRCTRHTWHTRRTAHGMHKLPFCVNSMRMLFNLMSDSLPLPHLLHLYGVVTSYRLDRDIQTSISISHIHIHGILCAFFFFISSAPEWQCALQMVYCAIQWLERWRTRTMQTRTSTRHPHIHMAEHACTHLNRLLFVYF